MPHPPLTPAQHSRASERRALAAGAIRTPGGILPAAAAQALDALMQQSYAHSKTEAIARALVEASLIDWKMRSSRNLMRETATTAPEFNRLENAL